MRKIALGVFILGLSFISSANADTTAKTVGSSNGNTAGITSQSPPPPSPIIETDSTDNMTACGAILCLSGPGGAACAPYLNAFYSIIGWRHGFPDPWRTLQKRTNFINGCGSAPSSAKSSVLSKFGSLV